MAFHTIYIPPGLSRAEYRRALRLGPAAVASRGREQRELLRSAGFVAISETDLTAEFLGTAQAWAESRDRHAAELRRREGDAQFEESLAADREMIGAIQEGLLRRCLLVAERPP